jgi:ribosome-associated translation inhibitor RaiA
MEDVQLVSDVKLPSMIRRQIQEQASRFRERHAARFGFSRVHMHMKHDGPQIACNLNFVTDDGIYNAYATGWDVRLIIAEVLDSADFQIIKRIEKRAARAA